MVIILNLQSRLGIIGILMILLLCMNMEYPFIIFFYKDPMHTALYL